MGLNLTSGTYGVDFQASLRDGGTAGCIASAQAAGFARDFVLIEELHAAQYHAQEFLGQFTMRKGT